jgi:hypothetical protein
MRVQNQDKSNYDVALHGIILEGKPIDVDQKKELKGELMVLRTKV